MGPLFGKFTDQQKEWLVTWEESLSEHELLMVKQQKQWQRDFVNAMRYQNDLDTLHKQMTVLMQFHRTDHWLSDLRSILDENQVKTYALVAKMVNSQSPEQREKMNNKLDDYIQDFEELHTKK